MLRLHNNFKPKVVAIATMASESIPGQSVSVTDMVAGQNFNLPPQNIYGDYSSQGSPMIPRLNCDVFDAIDYSRWALAQKAKEFEAEKVKRKEAEDAAKLSSGASRQHTPTADPPPPEKN